MGESRRFLRLEPAADRGIGNLAPHFSPGMTSQT